jgi:hypothetical protein
MATRRVRIAAPLSRTTKLIWLSYRTRAGAPMSCKRQRNDLGQVWTHDPRRSSSDGRGALEKTRACARPYPDL